MKKFDESLQNSVSVHKIKTCTSLCCAIVVDVGVEVGGGLVEHIGSFQYGFQALV